jgi:hypothetical protein
MIVGRGGTTALSDLPAAHGLAGTARPQRTIKERRDPRAAPRGHRVTPPGQQTTTVLGGSSGVCSTDPVTVTSLPIASDRQPGCDGRPFHALIVRNIRDHYQLPSREQRLRATGLIPLAEIATRLGVSTATIKNWYHAGLIGGQRYNDKNEVLYNPPGPNPPTPHQGQRLTTR